VTFLLGEKHSFNGVSYVIVPDMLPKMQVDKGAIKFVLGGANIMCPGLTHPTGSYMDPVEEHTIVAVIAEGKQYAMAVGMTQMSTEAM
jgi:PUA domain protein